MVVMAQPHRGYTFDSPGLPTIGGYPGEQGVRDATPLGGCTFFLCAIEYIKCNHPWHRIVMIYTVTKMGMMGKWREDFKKVQPPRG